MNNIKFTYLYRDAGNYKKWADVVFSNPDGLSPARITEALLMSFLTDGLFIAHQIRIPEVFLSSDQGLTLDDHCFHEFSGVEVSSNAPNDKYVRSIALFIAEVNHEAKMGWRAFDPYDRLANAGRRVARPLK
jgi:hypothetical protein